MVAGSMIWERGTIAGFGTLMIGSQATLSMDVSSNQFTETLDGVTLDNAGAASLGGDGAFGLSLENNAVFDNQPGASFTFLNGPSGVYVTSDGTATSFKNEGDLTQAGTGGDEIDPAFIQTATGSTAIQSGSLELGNSAISGPITGAAGTLLYFTNSASLDASSSITTAGSVRFDGPTVEDGSYDVAGSTIVNGPVTFESDATITDLGSDLQIGGVLDLTTPQSFSFTSLELYGTFQGAGSGNVMVAGSMIWERGTIAGFGTLMIGSQATLSMDVSSNQFTETLDGVTLDNAGAASLGGDGAFGLSLENNAVFDNQPGASFTFLNGPSGVYVTSDGTATSFKNEGDLTQAGTGGDEIDPAFIQTATGSTAIQSGSLELGNSAISGPITGGAGTLLYFTNSASLDASSSITTAGSVRFDGPTVEDGSYDVAGSTIVNGPVTFESDATITDLGSDLQIGGVLDLTTPQSFSFTSLEPLRDVPGGGIGERDGRRLDDLGEGNDCGIRHADDREPGDAKHGRLQQPIHRDPGWRDAGQRRGGQSGRRRRLRSVPGEQRGL